MKIENKWKVFHHCLFCYQCYYCLARYPCPSPPWCVMETSRGQSSCPCQPVRQDLLWWIWEESSPTRVRRLSRWSLTMWPWTGVGGLVMILPTPATLLWRQWPRCRWWWCWPGGPMGSMRHSAQRWRWRTMMSVSVAAGFNLTSVFLVFSTFISSLAGIIYITQGSSDKDS